MSSFVNMWASLLIPPISPGPPSFIKGSIWSSVAHSAMSPGSSFHQGGNIFNINFKIKWNQPVTLESRYLSCVRQWSAYDERCYNNMLKLTNQRSPPSFWRERSLAICVIRDWNLSMSNQNQNCCFLHIQPTSYIEDKMEMMRCSIVTVCTNNLLSQKPIYHFS